MKNLLFVTHTPSDNTRLMVAAMLDAVTEQQLTELRVKQISAFECNAEDILQTQAIILFTPENLGYMSGALKDFFDRCYYPCLEKCQGLPVSLIVRAGHDGTGTVNAVKSITNGLKWTWVQEPLVCKGEWDHKFIEQCQELAATVAVSLDCGII